MSMLETHLVDPDGTTMSGFFAFESDMERSLGCIPMSVRLKLDCCGIKLSLENWNQFPLETRRGLLAAPCDDPCDVARYRDDLSRLIRTIVGDEPKMIPIAEWPPWEEEEIPRQIAEKAVGLRIDPPSTAQWRRLGKLQRFALTKLSRAGHESRNFVPALREFGLL